MHISDSSHLRGIFVLLGSLLLCLAGAALVIYSAHMTRAAVAKRVDMVLQSARLPDAGASSAMAPVRSGPPGSKEREVHEVARLLSRVGIPARRAATILIVARVVVILILGMFGFVAASHLAPVSGGRGLSSLIAVAFGLAGWFVPGMIISRLIKAHTKAIVAGLPDALELLVICVEAGLAFESGIDRIVGVLRASQPALAEELALTSADLKILPGRDQALNNLAERVDAPSVRSVTTTLSQTLRYGTPLTKAIRMVAAELRNDTIVRLEERANQLPTLMTIPMMLFIMPTIFMIVGGPAALRIMDVLKH